MFTHSIDPIALQLGPLAIRWYGILMALAFLCGYFLFRKLARERNISEKISEEYFLWMIVSLIVGARLGHILFYNLEFFLQNPLEIFAVWHGGLASHGAMILGVIATIVFCKKNNIQFYDLADIIVIPIALGAAFVRLGNFVNGELVGKITTLPWAVKFQGYEGFRHPSQLYEAAKNVLLARILYRMRLITSLPKGFIFWSFIWIYAVMRFTVEMVKDMPLVGPYGIFTTAQWLSMVFFIISSAAIAYEYIIKGKYLKATALTSVKKSKKR
ncbi:MAG TPA: prolipoprotein diacylglyceryl transferase [Candidatus Nanoarchaeia archaeon]|nr:prolipoprotein diacylglyceryl transferase [Candidatus Nanoarchaeia archaeon]